VVEVQPYPLNGDYCVAVLLIWSKEDIKYADILNIKIVEINSENLEILKLSNEKIEEVITIIEKYYNGNEMDTTRDICVYSEFITQKLIEKIEKKKVVGMKFQNMVNKLCNIEKEKYKYNYSYLGSMLYPIYFLRNELQHGIQQNKNIEINKNHTQIIFNLFIEILKYLAKEQISFLY